MTAADQPSKITSTTWSTPDTATACRRDGPDTTSRMQEGHHQHDHLPPILAGAG